MRYSFARCFAVFVVLLATGCAPVTNSAEAPNSLTTVGSVSTSEVVIGSDGWLFLRTAVDQACFSPYVDTFVASASRASEILALMGTELTILVAPDKAAVYDDKVSGTGCAVESAASLVDASSKLPFVVFPFAAQKELQAVATSETDRPYYRYDSHWSWLGAAAASREIIDSINAGLWNADHVLATGLKAHAGDLSNLLGIRRFDYVRELSTVRPDAVTSETTLPQLILPDGTPLKEAGSRHFTTTSIGSSLVRGETLLMHDSFGWDLMPTLSPYFESLTTVRYNFVDDATEQLIKNSDRIVLEYVQRNFWARVADRPIDEAFAAVLADQMIQLGFSTTRTDDGVTISADLPASCSGAYLVVDRPSSAAVSVTVDGEPLTPVAGSTRSASYSPTGSWEVVADQSIMATIEVVTICD